MKPSPQADSLLVKWQRCRKLKTHCLRGLGEGMMQLHKCRNCGTQFAASDARDYRQFCSDSCEWSWWNNNMLEHLVSIIALVEANPFRLSA